MAYSMNMKVKLLAATAIAMASPSSAAYAGAIKAKVTDAGNTASMRAAEIRINKLDRAAITERDGSSSFTGLQRAAASDPIPLLACSMHRMTTTAPMRVAFP